MIYKRMAARLRAQDWVAILIELTIVIVGVFVGTQVSNWNQSRLERLETRRMLTQLDPQLQTMRTFFSTARDYYGVTRAYSATALAGWRGDPRVSDAEFVIAAYQASQIYVLGTNSATWSAVLGADRLRDIEDPALRADLSFLMTSDYTIIDQPAVDTPYRRNVRRIIPVEIQDAIRARCSDRPLAANPLFIILPAHCDLRITPALAAQAAALLRARPELRDDLQWHVAAIANFLTNTVNFDSAAHRVQEAVRHLG